LSTTNPTWTVPGSNPSLRGGRPSANRLSHDTALAVTLTLPQVVYGQVYDRVILPFWKALPTFIWTRWWKR
jgi:hypothetical protein